MAEGKKSFLLYADLLSSVEHLTDTELGILFRHLLEYVNDKNPELTDRLLLTAWKPIERSLKDDLKKWEEIRVKRSEAGAKGGKQKQANVANATFDNQNVANVAVSVNDNVTVNVNDNVIQSIEQQKSELINAVMQWNRDNGNYYDKDFIDYFLNFWNTVEGNSCKYKTIKKWDLTYRLNTSYQGYRSGRGDRTENGYRVVSRKEQWIMNTDA